MCTRWILLVWFLLGEGVVICAQPQSKGDVRFNRDIRPILSNHCFQCHGPDLRGQKGGLRLDVRDQATGMMDSGIAAIVPGHPNESALMERVRSHNADLVMPPVETGKPLSAAQIQLLNDWIASGAEYEQHWAYLPIQQPEVPHPVHVAWGRNEIDAFILLRLEREQLPPSPEADAATLIRRLSLDLTGLPPSVVDVDAFVQELAQASVVSSNEPGSNQQAATADSANDRANEVYLRWVNHLLKSPHYGERMAVDWLDAARFADTNGYQVDRDREMYAWRDWVINAFNSNMPFDQFTLEQMAGDLLPDPSLSQRIATGFHRNHMLNEEGGVIPEEFLAEYCADRVETTATVWLGHTLNCARCHDHKFDPFTQRDYYGLYAFFHNISEGGIGNYGANIRRSAPPVIQLPAPEIEQQIVDLRREKDDVAKKLQTLEARLLTEQPEWEESLQQKLTAAESTSPDGKVPAEIVAVLQADVSARSDEQKTQLTNYQKSTNSEHSTLSERAKAIPGLIDALDLQIPTTLVMQELPAPRVTKILQRGVYSQPGDVVTAETPAALPKLPAGIPQNRLGLARWLTDPANPLPARVTVNRLWQSIFGIGLVRTSEDFGTQGEAPSHPELLDWLAAEFISSGWDVQHILRLIVTSSTYRQSSRRTEALHQRDPENRLLARGPRFRLQSEFIRDQALFVSGLLVSKIGGPSVKPYHPAGLYEQVTAGSGTNVYVEGTGDDLYRRSMYTYWKRSVPNPAMLAFDSPFRETCTVRRTRTNTPLQALNLMNDPTYVEAARLLAIRMLREGGPASESQVTLGFRLVLSRPPRPAELQILTMAYDRAVQDFRNDGAAAEEVLKVGATPTTFDGDRSALAAMMTVASMILNLDETVMKE